MIAINNDVPIFVVFAALALLLIGGATWLSLAVRRRPETECSNTIREQDIVDAVWRGCGNSSLTRESLPISLKRAVTMSYDM